MQLLIHQTWLYAIRAICEASTSRAVLSAYPSTPAPGREFLSFFQEGLGLVRESYATAQFVAAA